MMEVSVETLSNVHEFLLIIQTNMNEDMIKRSISCRDGGTTLDNVIKYWYGRICNKRIVNFMVSNKGSKYTAKIIDYFKDKVPRYVEYDFLLSFLQCTDVSVIKEYISLFSIAERKLNELTCSKLWSDHYYNYGTSNHFWNKYVESDKNIIIFISRLDTNNRATFYNWILSYSD